MADEFQRSTPIYLQLAERIQRKIMQQELEPGTKLPSVREMAIQSGLNSNTVQRTYSELERMGIVEVRRGQGTFITEDPNRLQQMREDLRQQQIRNFVQVMGEMGFTAEEMLAGMKDYLDHEGGKQDETTTSF